MHLRNSFISTTRCDDLARATEAQDGKKNHGLTHARLDTPSKMTQPSQYGRPEWSFVAGAGSR